MRSKVYQMATYGLEVPQRHHLVVFELQEQVVLGSQLKEELRERGMGCVGLGGSEDRLEARGQLQLKGLKFKRYKNRWNMHRNPRVKPDIGYIVWRRRLFYVTNHNNLPTSDNTILPAWW